MSHVINSRALTGEKPCINKAIHALLMHGYATRNNAKFSKCFQFLCNNSGWTWFFNALTFARSLGRCWKPRPPASVFNTSLGTWRMLMYEKTCLIPIFKRFSTATMLWFLDRLKRTKSNEPKRKKTYHRTCAPREDSDQPAHSYNLIIIFTGLILGSQGGKISSCRERRP